MFEKRLCGGSEKKIGVEEEWSGVITVGVTMS